MEVLWMGMSLPLAPASKFIQGLYVVQSEADKVAHQFPAHSVIHSFVAYLRSTWAPLAKEISHHDGIWKIDNRVENVHNLMESSFGGKHQDYWAWLRKYR